MTKTVNLQSAKTFRETADKVFLGIIGIIRCIDKANDQWCLQLLHFSDKGVPKLSLSMNCTLRNAAHIIKNQAVDSVSVHSENTEQLKHMMSLVGIHFIVTDFEKLLIPKSKL